MVLKGDITLLIVKITAISCAGKPPQDPAKRSSSAQPSGNLGPQGSGLLGSARTEERFSDEYDPARPNEYEAVRKDKERVREEAQQEADRQEELRLLQVSLTGQLAVSGQLLFWHVGR